MRKKRAWILILMSIVITFLVTIQAVTHVQDERSRADVNQDGLINILDLVIVAKYLGEQDEKDDREPIPTSVETVPEPIVEQPPVEEVPEELIFNPQPPKKPDVTGIAGIIESDRVLEADDSFLIDYSHLIFNDFVSATQSDVVKDYFKYAERWIANNCRKERKASINIQTLFFISRDARIEFIRKVLDYEDYEESPETVGRPLPEDLWWRFDSINVSVVDDKPYFELKFYINWDHPECRP